MHGHRALVTQCMVYRHGWVGINIPSLTAKGQARLGRAAGVQ